MSGRQEGQPVLSKMLNTFEPQSGAVPGSAATPFLEEDHFHQIPALERKRAGRSGNTSLLVNIENSCFNGGEGNITVERVESLLGLILRETDIKGWYKLGCIIGVIFTELGDSELFEAKSKILK